MNATVAEATVVRSEGRYFYVWMAGISVAIAFGGFIPTFWFKIAAGTFHAPPLVYVHGALFFTWTVFFSCRPPWWPRAARRTTALGDWRA
jgi:hypothetical protein